MSSPWISQDVSQEEVLSDGVTLFDAPDGQNTSQLECAQSETSVLLLQTAPGLWLFNLMQSQYEDLPFLPNQEVATQPESDDLSADPEDVSPSAKNDTLTGTPDDDVLAGGKGHDTLLGQDGDDVLIGDDGRDQLVGGNGDDFYVVQNNGDTVIEVPGEGNDTVQLMGLHNYQLGEALEDVIVAEASSPLGTVHVVGNDLDNHMTSALYWDDEGQVANVLLDGQAGNDTVEGGAGDDTLLGGVGDDWISDVTGGNNTVVYHLGDGSDNIYLAAEAWVYNSDQNTLSTVEMNNIVDFSQDFKLGDIADWEVQPNIDGASANLLLHTADGATVTLAQYFSVSFNGALGNGSGYISTLHFNDADVGFDEVMALLG